MEGALRADLPKEREGVEGVEGAREGRVAGPTTLAKVPGKTEGLSLAVSLREAGVGVREAKAEEKPEEKLEK